MAEEHYLEAEGFEAGSTPRHWNTKI